MNYAYISGRLVYTGTTSAIVIESGGCFASVLLDSQLFRELPNIGRQVAIQGVLRHDGSINGKNICIPEDSNDTTLLVFHGMADEQEVYLGDKALDCDVYLDPYHPQIGKPGLLIGEYFLRGIRIEEIAPDD